MINFGDVERTMNEIHCLTVHEARTHMHTHTHTQPQTVYSLDIAMHINTVLLLRL